MTDGAGSETAMVSADGAADSRSRSPFVTGDPGTTASGISTWSSYLVSRASSSTYVLAEVPASSAPPTSNSSTLAVEPLRMPDDKQPFNMLATLPVVVHNQSWDDQMEADVWKALSLRSYRFGEYFGSTARELVVAASHAADETTRIANCVVSGTGGVLGLFMGGGGKTSAAQEQLLEVAEDLKDACIAAHASFVRLTYKETNLMRALEEARDRAAQTGAAIKEAHVQIENLEGKLVQASQEGEERTTEIESLKAAQADHAETLVKLQHATDAKTILQKRIEELSIQLDATIKDKVKVEEDWEGVEQRLAAVQSALEAARSERDVLKGEIKVMKSAHIQDVQELKTAAAVEISTAQDILNAERSSASASLSNIHNLLTAARESRDKAHAAQKVLKKTMKIKEEQIKRLDEELLATHESSAAKLREKEAELSTARQALAEEKKAMATLRGAHTALQERKTDLQALLESIINMPKVELQREVESLQQKLDAAHALEGQLRGQVEVRERNALKAYKEQADAERSSEGLQKQVDRLKGEATVKDNRIKGLVSDIGQVQGTFENRLTGAQGLIANLQQQLQSREAAQEGLREGYVLALQRQREQFEARLRGIDAHYAREAQARQQQHLGELAARGAQLQAEIQARLAAEEGVAALQQLQAQQEVRIARMKSAADGEDAQEAVFAILMM